MDSIITLIKARFSSNSPVFFVKIRNWAFIIGLVAAGVLTLPFAFPTWATALLTLLIGVCTGLSGGTSITTTDEKIIQKTEKLFPAETKLKKRFSFFKPFKKRNQIINQINKKKWKI